MFLRNYIITLCFLIILFKQSVNSQITDLKFDRISIENGLSQNSVNCIMEDSKGFLWFGTYDGLNKYDGYEFKIFKHNPKDSNTLSNSNIRDIFEDHLGFIWIATDNGLNKYNPETDKFIRYYHDPNDSTSLSSNSISCITQDNNTTLWFGTNKGILNRFDKVNNQFIKYNISGSRPYPLLKIVQDKFEEEIIKFYISTSLGVKVFIPSKNDLQFLNNQPDAIYNKRSSQCIFNTKDYLWIGLWDEGLIQYNKQTKTYKQYKNIPGDPNSLSYNIVQSIWVTENNTIWIGTRGGGLNRFIPESGKFITYKKHPWYQYSISDDAIMSIFQSKSGILWFGTFMGGISKLSIDQGKNKFAHFLPGYVISAITEDDNGNFYLGSRYKGLIRFNYNTGEMKDYSNIPHSPKIIISILNPPYSSTNFILVGTEGEGLFKFYYNEGRFEKFCNKITFNSNIFSIYQDKLENFWIGTWNMGLFLVDKNGKLIHSFKSIQGDSNSISSNVITSIIQDRNGVFYLGTKGGGFNKLIYNYSTNSFKITQYKKNDKDTNSLINNDIFVIYPDDLKNIWLGSMGGGLIKFNPRNKTFINYNELNGLKSTMIYGIIEDSHHNLWVTTNRGIAKFNTKIEKFISYDIRDGIQDNTFSTNGYFKNKNNLIIIGGNNGINIFNPDSIRANINTYIAPVVITDFKLLKGDLTYNNIPSEIYLKYIHNDFLIKFSILDYTFSERNTYKYKLEGYDEDWIKTDATNRIAKYTNLKPGEYVFRVKGSNNDNVENEKGTSLYIFISPPFWHTTWFILILLLITLTLLYFLIKKIIEQYIKKTKLTEENLFAKENQLRTLIDNLPDFIYIKDRNCKFILANNKLSRVMIGVGHTADELIGKCDHDYYEKSLADLFYNDEQEVMHSGEALIGRIEPGIDEEGNPSIVSSTKVPIKNEKGEVIGIVGIGRDITLLKKAEEKIKEQAENLQETNTLLEERQEQILQQKEEMEAQRDELERLNATKDKFFSIIGHDLKNPFHAIISLSDLLKNNYNSIKDPEKIEIIEMIKGSSENAYELLENLLQWSRSQTGRIVFNPEYIDLKDVTNDNIELLKVTAEKKEIDLITNLNKILLVFADRNMVNTIIRNLINNSIKFTNNGGKIIIDFKENTDTIDLIITDNGVGMDESTRKKLFKLAEHHTTEGTSGEVGTGLGLIICKEFIDQNKGTIKVESEVGKGSTFIVSLPKR